MSDVKELEALKSENENLKNQMQQNSVGVQQLFNQLEAHKGELADSRVISLQLRSNLVQAQKAYNELQEENKALKAKIEELGKKEAPKK